MHVNSLLSRAESLTVKSLSVVSKTLTQICATSLSSGDVKVGVVNVTVAAKSFEILKEQYNFNCYYICGDV